ncbi:MAG: hypothetical protein ACKO66_07575, partial [Flavobacteriales bacterium]
MRKIYLTLMPLAIAASCYGQAVNDAPCNALPIIVDGPVVAGHNTLATVDVGEVTPPVLASIYA